MKFVMLWVQTNAPAEVYIKYWEKGNKTKIYTTEKVKTEKSNAFAAHIACDSVDYSKNYEYELYIDNNPISFDYPFEFQTPKFWQWREDPPTIRIAIGSCAFINDEHYDRPGRPYDCDYHIFRAIMIRNQTYAMVRR